MSPPTTPPRLAVREVTSTDGDLLVDMLLECVNWDGAGISRRRLLATPELARYATGWGRDGDLGLVALDLHGPRGLMVPVGVAWSRLFTQADPGYAYLAPDVPEVALAIVPGRRGLGIGQGLLSAIAERSRAAGVERLSVSVARGNPAVRLYERAGFEVAEGAPSASESNLVMALDLTRR